MYTEEDARKKWCQETSGPDGHFEGRCLASECMAWRWVEPQRAILKAAMIPTEQYSITLADAIKNGGEYTVIPNSGNGFCGLAGRP